MAKDHVRMLGAGRLVLAVQNASFQVTVAVDKISISRRRHGGEEKTLLRLVKGRPFYYR
jgi:hypothetical protein